MDTDPPRPWFSRLRPTRPFPSEEVVGWDKPTPTSLAHTHVWTRRDATPRESRSCVCQTGEPFVFLCSRSVLDPSGRPGPAVERSDEIVVDG